MGGTFDPIHYGHLVTAQEACYQFDLDKVIFMPTGNPPHKQRNDILPAKQRFLMTSMAIADNEAFDISDLEVKNELPSYTVDTLTKLKEVFVESEFYFITGADAIADISTWKDPQKAAALTKFVAASRPGFSLKPGVEVIELEVPALAISSTDIRQRVKEGRPFRYLLPDKVWRYIVSKELYK